MGANPQAAESTLDEETVLTPALHHINLKTTRMDEIIEWYGVVAGMTLNFRGEAGAFLTNDEANHRIAITAVPGLQVDEDKVIHDGMHHVAFEYDSLDGLLGTYARLKGQGILPHACVDHGLTMSFYYLDPDGNSVEMQSDNYGDWAQSTAFMREDPRFAANPIGEFVDPDALLELRRQGVGLDEIHDRAYSGEFPPSGPIDLRFPAPPPAA
jgi:catechol-2,3-dioxygenase